MKNYLILSLSIICFSSFGQIAYANKQYSYYIDGVKVSAKDVNYLFYKADTVIVLSDRIKLAGQFSHEFEAVSFKPIAVFLDSKEVFHDSLNEYWLTGLSSRQYPKLLNCSDGSFQLLVEVDERPNQNELRRITISKEGRVKTDNLPIFKWNPLDTDNDGKVEVEGILTNGETISDGDTAYYNPTIVYEISNQCLALDRQATRSVNKKIWGKFYGYLYNEKLLLPFKRLRH